MVIQIRKLCVVILMGLITLSVNGQHAGWKDQKGGRVPDADFMKSKDGFGGSVLVTTDADWREKWNTPSTTVPSFAQAKTVPHGKHIFVLIFFANPKLMADKRADVACDIDLIRPDGGSALHQVNAPCFQGILKGDPYNTYLSAPVVEFVGEPDDPVGIWAVRIWLKDNLRNVALPLKTSFTLE